jgi:hypothetical protein
MLGYVDILPLFLLYGCSPYRYLLRTYSPRLLVRRLRGALRFSLLLLSLSTATETEEVELVGELPLSAIEELAKLQAENVALKAELETLRQAKEHYRRNELSAMIAVVGDMAKPVLLSDFDRVGFIRMRKVASTAVHFFLKDTLHYEDCLLSQCLYSTGVRRFACPKGKEDPYQCNHDKPYRIQSRFEGEKALWQQTASVAHLKQETAQARLYLVAVLRDPAQRIVSDYFYTMHGAWVPEQFKVCV